MVPVQSDSERIEADSIFCITFREASIRISIVGESHAITIQPCVWLSLMMQTLVDFPTRLLGFRGELSHGFTTIT